MHLTMKIRPSLLVLLAALIALPFTPVQSAETEPETELGTKMEKMGGAFRVLRRQISDASMNADSLARIAVIKENAQAALKLLPVKKKDLPAADQARFAADYQARMKEFIGVVNKAEAALKAGKNDEAAKLLGVMADAQKQGHRDFQKKKKKAS
jgi:soluble cytochrome b562